MLGITPQTAPLGVRREKAGPQPALPRGMAAAQGHGVTTGRTGQACDVPTGQHAAAGRPPSRPSTRRVHGLRQLLAASSQLSEHHP